MSGPRRGPKHPGSLRHGRFGTRLRSRGVRLAWQLRGTRDSETTKRALDVVLAAGFLILSLPVLAGIALLIKLHDGGPPLYWQARVGRFGREFRFPKFRTMCVDAERMHAFLRSQNVHGDGITFKVKSDPRITPIGRVLRRFSLDELPQLWCILRGEMSVVGPRPPLPSEVARYAVADRRRLDATPGLTCIWQVSGRANVPFERQLEMDVDYIERRSLLLDLELVARTVPAALSGRGAY